MNPAFDHFTRISILNMEVIAVMKLTYRNERARPESSSLFVSMNQERLR